MRILSIHFAAVAGSYVVKKVWWKKVFSKRENTPFSIFNLSTRTVVTNLQSFTFLINAFLFHAFWREKDIKYSLIVSLFYRVSDTFAAEKELMGLRKRHWNVKTSTIGGGLTLFTITRLMARHLSSSRFWKKEKNPRETFSLSLVISLLSRERVFCLDWFSLEHYSSYTHVSVVICVSVYIYISTTFRKKISPKGLGT